MANIYANLDFLVFFFVFALQAREMQLDRWMDRWIGKTCNAAYIMAA